LEALEEAAAETLQKNSDTAAESKKMEEANVSGMVTLYDDMMEADPDKSNINSFSYLIRDVRER